ncbi:MAG: hypothetical protein JSV25_05370 [Spirochaetota bacterium]|nr:MAG: hypothetical protein JSV25_05370 [Spirochaetota bacterium]
MGFSRQKQNKAIFVPLLFSLILLFPSLACPDIFEYDPELDVALGMLGYFQGDGENVPSIKPGPYIGAYLSMKSPIFVYFFNSENVYNMFEAGVAVNEIKEQVGSSYIVNIPVSVDFAYSFEAFPKFSILPFVGFGVGLNLSSRGSGESFPLYPFVKTGFELRYLLWEDTHLRFKLDYGIAFISEVETGFIPFLKVRFPLPFLP